MLILGMGTMRTQAVDEGKKFEREQGKCGWRGEVKTKGSMRECVGDDTVRSWPLNVMVATKWTTTSK